MNTRANVGFPDSPGEGETFRDWTYINGRWEVPSVGAGFVEEALSDGVQYGRQNETWTEIVIPTDFEETDPTVPEHVKGITQDDIDTWNAGGGGLWEENGSDIYYDSGNVGIGTDSPTAPLHVEGNNALVTRFSHDSVEVATKYIQVVNASGSTSGLNLIAHGDNSASVFNQSSADLKFGTNDEVRMRIDATGNVGIGTDSPTTALSVEGGWVASKAVLSIDSTSTQSGLSMQKNGVSQGYLYYDSQHSAINLYGAGNKGVNLWTNNTQRLTIDPTGNVGIGMEPATRTAKEQLAEWKTRFDARLKAEPKADKKAVTLEITDDAFEVLPTEEALAEWMETRGAGDRLQVNGNGSFSGELTTRLYNLSGQDIWTKGGSGIRFNSSTIFPLDGNGDITSTGPDFGSSDRKFSNAYFSGTVNATAFVGDGSGLTGVGGVGGELGSTMLLTNESAPADNQKFGLSVQSSGDINFQARKDDGAGGGNMFRMTRTGGGIDRLQCIKAGSEVAYWDVSTGSITAPDFIATSDERVKDNITTAPVGLIDSLKGREWDWKESGEKGSGVVAQELEEVLPHLVKTDDEGMKSVSYMGLCAYLIEEVKALRAEVEALK